ncbi:GNAT family N-acetyltransferase [Roseomonas rosulenta]|uniref:GNAT family N-acetyltransferase n=1 Tax=Roseomonas rosulenta TaxID=2748667 RepID=UPI0018DEFF23
MNGPRPARPDEAPALRDLVRAAYAKYVPRLGREPAPMLDDYAARIAAGQAWVLEEGGALVGALVLEDEPGALMLYNIAVAPTAQGRGVGKRLIAFTEAEARRRGYTLLRLFTNEKMVENVAMYAHLDFTETHRGSEAGHRRVYFEKRLSRSVMTLPMAPVERWWARIAKALHRDAQGTVHVPSRGALAFYAAVFLVIAPLGALSVADGVQRLAMSRSWTRGTAEVLALSGPTVTGHRRHYDLVLRRVEADGAVVHARAIFPQPSRMTWSEPPRVPQPGDRVDVVIDPADPHRMTTIDSLGGLPGGGIAFGIGMSAVAAIPLAGLATGLWLRRRSRGSATKNPSSLPSG